MAKSVILTGLRANSEFHLGNYLGAILPMVALQRSHSDEYQINMFIPDLHSLTTPIDYKKLHNQIIDNLKIFIAAGIDIDNKGTFLYRQSYIPAHSELTWILDCFTHFGEASRMIEFKEKSKRIGNESVSVGLFNYPILMAADILLYNASYVPVGEDQRQHVELARELAQRINNKFKADILVVPHDWSKQMKFLSYSNGVRIRSLRNPDNKMSKSVSDPSGTILLSDKPEEAAKKIMTATTDSLKKIDFNFANQPGISNLLQILALLTSTDQEETNMKWRGKDNYVELKSEVARVVSDFLRDLQIKLSRVTDNAVREKLVSDEKLVTGTANETLLRVQRAVGLRADS